MHPYPEAVDLADFVEWTGWVLRTNGFHASTSLPLVSVCRDELMAPFVAAVTARWGHCFDMSSLGGLPHLGRTGIAAALGHAPGEGGRHRLVVFAFPHIGAAADGDLGTVRRPGVPGTTTACGAVEVARTALAEGVSGVVLDPHDVEESLLVGALRSVVGDAPPPGLVELTELVRQAAVEELSHLLSGLASSAVPVDFALISGVLVHGAEDDRVSVVSAQVRGDGETRDLLRRSAR